MKDITRFILRTVFCLLLFFQLSTSWANSTDDSWNQVFQFQLKLAQQGNVEAQFILGEMYEHGRGVAKDLDSAIVWYRKAEKNGQSKADQRISEVQQMLRLKAQKKDRALANKKHREQEKAHQLALHKQQIEAEKTHQLVLQKQQAEAENTHQLVLQKQQAEAKKTHQLVLQKQQAEAENTHQLILQKQQAEEKQLKPPAKAQDMAVAKLHQNEETTSRLSREELAKKVKQAQKRADEIVHQNALRQQRQADAKLKQYRDSIMPGPANQPQNSDKNIEYQDPFE